MQIEIDRDLLVETSQAALRVVASRATLPVLAGIRIRAEEKLVELAATDLEVFVRVEGDFAVKSPGTLVVPGKLFGEILRSLPAGRVDVSGDQGDVTIRAGRSEFVVSGFPPADFPQIPQIDESTACAVEGRELAAALKQVVRSASTDEARPVLTGVLWEIEGGTLWLVSTDSYRLGVRELAVKEGPAEARAVIPGRALAEFARHLGDSTQAEVRLGESQAGLRAGRVEVTTRLIEGEFPNYRQLIPENYMNVLDVGTKSFIDAVDRVGLVAQVNTPVKLHLGEEVLLTASESGVGEASEVIEDANYRGEPMVVAFNPRFLKDGMEGVESERSEVEVGDPAKPAVLRGAGRPEFLYLLMPVRPPG